MTEQMFLDRHEAAEATGVSPDTIRRAIRKGALKAKRSGKNKDGDGVGKFLISRKALEDWFEGLEDA